MATVYKRTSLTGGTAVDLDYIDGAVLSDGDFAFVLDGTNFSIYQLDADSGLTDDGVNVIAPDANAGTKRWILQRTPVETTVPVGVVVPFIGGFFTNAANAGFTNVIGNDAATINALLNADGWYVCNGAAVNNAGSSIFNGAGRYLPNLSDSRFLMGSTGAGTIGGATSSAHTHTTGNFTLGTSHIPAHTHTTDGYNGSTAGQPLRWLATGSADNYVGTISVANNTGGGAAHNHGTTGAASATENRPLFLSCHYIMKVI